MDGKEKVLLKLIEELHGFCKENGILYYLAETEKTAWSASLMMDAENIRKFLGSFRCPAEGRALEWAGTNHSFSGDSIKYVDTDTLFYTQGRLIREINLGMFVSIKPLSKSSSKLAKLDRYHKHLDFGGSEKRSAFLNKAASKVYSSKVAKTKGKLKKKEIAETSIYGTPVYVRKSSAFAETPDAAWDRLIVRKKNNDEFMCDETISFRDLGLEEDRKALARYERKIAKPRIDLKRGEALQNECVQVSTASFCRFCVATDLLQKYSYEEIASLGAEPGEVKDALDTYIGRAVKLRKKNYSAYIGDEFTKVINKLYPEIDTDDLYAFTPDLYKEGIKLHDYKGNLIGVYGGRKGGSDMTGKAGVNGGSDEH
ncbi:MAG: hypothetical protein IKA24_09805 [Mogibacterium sp.]|nr:hypothetical protein [Mogibacterium sp.]